MRALGLLLIAAHALGGTPPGCGSTGHLLNGITSFQARLREALDGREAGMVRGERYTFRVTNTRNHLECDILDSHGRRVGNADLWAYEHDGRIELVMGRVDSTDSIRGQGLIKKVFQALHDSSPPETVLDLNNHNLETGRALKKIFDAVRAEPEYQRLAATSADDARDYLERQSTQRATALALTHSREGALWVNLLHDAGWEITRIKGSRGLYFQLSARRATASPN